MIYCGTSTVQYPYSVFILQDEPIEFSKNINLGNPNLLHKITCLPKYF